MPNTSLKTKAVAFRIPRSVYDILARRATKQGKLVSDYLKARIIYDTLRSHEKKDE